MSHTAFQSPHLLVCTVTSVEVYDTRTGDWMQSSPLKRVSCVCVCVEHSLFAFIASAMGRCVYVCVRACVCARACVCVCVCVCVCACVNGLVLRSYVLVALLP